MATTLLPVFMFFFVLIFLAPPLSLIVAVFKRHRRSFGLVSLTVKTLSIAASFLPLVLNLGYLRSVWPDLAQGHVETDFMLGLALVVCWASLWARFAVRRMGRRKRQVYY